MSEEQSINRQSSIVNRHYSVMWQETLDGLDIQAGAWYVDGTLGAGGHSQGILERGGQVLGIDADPVALQLAAERLQEYGERARLVEGNFGAMAEIVQRENIEPVAGVVLDLGVSSMQLDDLERGFSFRGDGPLDMRFGPVQGSQTAADIINKWPENELVKLFFELGEEPAARRIASSIIAARKTSRIETTGQLAALVEKAVGKRAAGRDRKPIHPATKVFQALRMRVNAELERLEQGLAGADEVLAPGGRLAVISFHSLEDRIVKHFMQNAASDKQLLPNTPASLALPKVPTLKIITKKPILAGPTEQAENRRSRSAKLRVAQKL